MIHFRLFLNPLQFGGVGLFFAVALEPSYCVGNFSHQIAWAIGDAVTRFWNFDKNRRNLAQF